MIVSVKSKIWLTVFTIVILFAFFTLFYFPAQQSKQLYKSYEIELQDNANSVALGMRISFALQDFENVTTALEFVKDDPRLQFVSILEYDTTWSNDHRNYILNKGIFKTLPDNQRPDPDIQSSNDFIVKRAEFHSSVISGVLLLAFHTKEIELQVNKIRITAFLVSSMVLLIGLLVGYLLAKNISAPVQALRNAANNVEKGDFNQYVKKVSNDEIGELTMAFNSMVNGLSKAKKLDEQNQALTQSNTALNDALQKLKSAQSQLIQSEKMASLGELTAGIAHEIQNPLNFVNNFSEVNQELLEELDREINEGNLEDAKSMVKDIIDNEQKINHHGKRADAIVKGMLQHSRSSTGQKEPTDINALADEFLRLSYHGMRAKDKSFNSGIKTDFDKNIRKVEVVPEDIGRVLLNFFNNAFYAANEKKQKLNGTFEPIVSVDTKKVDNKIVLTVKDNGNGVPQKILDKIFQPFFTTKPTGEGTGLGLLLSYDIIKAHDGEIKVETKEGEGAEFIIELPG